MFFVFQESKIWEAGNPVDPLGKTVRIKAKNELRARRRLPETNLGRVWILIDTINNKEN